MRMLYALHYGTLALRFICIRPNSMLESNPCFLFLEHFGHTAMGTSKAKGIIFQKYYILSNIRFWKKDAHL